MRHRLLAMPFQPFASSGERDVAHFLVAADGDATPKLEELERLGVCVVIPLGYQSAARFGDFADEPLGHLAESNRLDEDQQGYDG